MLKRSQGFTLIEMLIAIAIFAFVAAISYSTLNNALLVRTKTDAFNQQLADLQLAIQIIDKDFRQIVNRPILDPAGGLQRPAVSLGSSESAIEFTHAGWPNPLQQQRSELQRVAYVLEDEKLIRQYWSQLDRASGSEALQVELLDNITELDITVLDEERQTHQFWPFDNTASTAMPIAIEVKMTSAQWGQLRRVYEIAR